MSHWNPKENKATIHYTYLVVVEVAINPTGLSSALVVGLLLFYYLVHYKSSWIKVPRNAATALIAVTVIMVPLQVYGSFQLMAYDTGSLFPMSFQYWESPVQLDAGEVYYSEVLSNVYTATDAFITITVAANESVPQHNVTFWLVDINLANNRYLEGNYSEKALQVRLPYLYSEFPQTPACWVIALENPFRGEPIAVTLRISSGEFEDSGTGTYFELVNIYVMPAIVITVSWVYVVGYQLTSRKRDKLSEYHEEESASGVAQS